MRWRLVLLACSTILGLGVPGEGDAAGVVGDGTPESCTLSAVADALAGGGLVTFQCGPAHKTIFVKTAIISNGTATTVDGGGRITLDGESLRPHFIVSDGGDLTLRDITLQHGVPMRAVRSTTVASRDSSA